jgi:hypothetical protein
MTKTYHEMHKLLVKPKMPVILASGLDPIFETMKNISMRQSCKFLTKSLPHLNGAIWCYVSVFEYPWSSLKRLICFPPHMFDNMFLIRFSYARPFYPPTVGYHVMTHSMTRASDRFPHFLDNRLIGREVVRLMHCLAALTPGRFLVFLSVTD